MFWITPRKLLRLWLPAAPPPASGAAMALPGKASFQQKVTIAGAWLDPSTRIRRKTLSVSAVTELAPSPMPLSVVSKNSSIVSRSASLRTNCCNGASRPGIATSPYCADFSKLSSAGLYWTG